ncbi:MAG: VWA domain-containing protein, partial [Gammaproteobacteria bacterium]|nr:VWA domain-containing protein [Gammaproteobacteria bacterium]
MMLLPEHFQFLRPQWFWAFIPLLLLLWLHWRQKLLSRSWRGVVDPKLLPHLLIGKVIHKQPWPMTMMAVAGMLAITALAGPVWEKLEQPVFRQQSALVILLDLSRSMDAADINPTRLQRAKLKLQDILKRRKEGQTAIITYAANAFVVTPLTTDTKTISSQLPGFSTDLMPMQGSRADRAIEKGIELLKQAGMKNGAVMLVTDGIEGAPTDKLNAQIQQLSTEGYRLLVLGVGTEEGAPIPQTNGGFYKDSQGNIILPKLDPQSLYHVAQQGQGMYQAMTTDDRDINNLLSLVDADVDNDQTRLADDMKSDQWQEQGYWLILPLLVIAAAGFRRGYLLALLIIILP